MNKEIEAFINDFVTDLAAKINIPAGQSLVFGNLPAVLTSESFVFNKSIAVYPNPTTNSFKLNGFVSETEIYNTTGQLVKQFKGGFDSEYTFNIEDLSNGVYMVKVADENQNEKSFKLVKE